MTETKRKMLTIKEAANLIEGITEYRVREMCRNGQVKCFKAGKKYLISEEAFLKAVFGNDNSDDDGGDAA